MDGEYLPDTPTLQKLRLASQRPENVEMTPTREHNNALLDPRSPNGCRTPLNVSCWPMGLLVRVLGS